MVFKNSYIMIGIAPYDIEQSNSSNHSKCGWYLYCNDGKLYSGPPTNFSRKSYCSSFSSGTIIDVELDISKGTIRYFIDGIDKGIAYEGISTNKSLRLAIEMYFPGASIQLLSYTRYE